MPETELVVPGWVKEAFNLYHALGSHFEAELTLASRHEIADFVDRVKYCECCNESLLWPLKTSSRVFGLRSNAQDEGRGTGVLTDESVVWRQVLILCE